MTKQFIVSNNNGKRITVSSTKKGMLQFKMVKLDRNNRIVSKATEYELPIDKMTEALIQIQKEQLK